jgi:hypothetical protein
LTYFQILMKINQVQPARSSGTSSQYLFSNCE